MAIRSTWLSGFKFLTNFKKNSENRYPVLTFLHENKIEYLNYNINPPLEPFSPHFSKVYYFRFLVLAPQIYKKFFKQNAS